MDLQDDLRGRIRRRRLLATRRYRSRRFWRTVSRRRRVIGAAALAFLLAVVLVVYYHTRSDRVERLAEEYLTDLTGRKVRIHEARFSPFEGIRLRKLEIRPPGDSRPRPPGPDAAGAVFRAEEVLLDLEPGSLLAGRLKVRRIVAVRPELIRSETPGSREPSYVRQELPRHGWNIRLPVIELREGRLIHYGRLRSKPEAEVEMFETSVTAQLRPDPAAGGRYLINGWAGRPRGELIQISGAVTLNPFRIDASPLTVQSIRQLPEEIEHILAKYQIDTSRVRIKGDYDAQAGELAVEFTCRGTRLTLPLSDLPGADEEPRKPPALAGPDARPDGPGPVIQLTDVTGTIRVVVRNTLAEEGIPDPSPAGSVQFRDLTGRINGQPFRLQGRYDGFAADAPFELELANDRFELPQDAALIARFPKSLQNVWDYFQPSGTVSIQAGFRRPDRGQDVQVHGVVRCLDVAGAYWRYPCRLERVSGTIEFDREQARLSLVGRRGESMVVSVDGTVGLTAARSLDLSVRGQGVPVNEEMLEVLSEQHEDHVAWLRRLNISGGTVSFDCRVVRGDRRRESIRTALTLSLNGVALLVKEFPYPVRVLRGRAELTGDGLKLRDLEMMPVHLLRGREAQIAPAPTGPGRPATQPEAAPSGILLADGMVRRDKEGRTEFRLDIVSPSLPLDETLWRAFPKSVAETLAQFHIDGRARVIGWIHDKPGKPLDYDVRGELNGGYLRYDGFPYTLESLNGQVHITPRTIEFTSCSAAHNAMPLNVEGRIAVADDQETALSIRADRVPLDDDLHAALSPEARKVWKQLSPTGWVALDVALRQGRADAKTGRPPMSTVVTVTALGNGITYQDFPYPLKNVTGQAVIYDDRIELVNMADEEGGRRIRLSGTIWPDRDNLNLPEGQQPRAQFELKLSAEGMSFDEPLRRAVPWRIRRRWNEVLPTGQFDLALDQLRYTPLGTTSRWDFAGRMDIHNGRGLLGVNLEGVKGQVVGRGTVVTGQAAGFVGQVALSEVTLAGRAVTSVKGRLILDARTGQLRLEELTGRLHGGHLSGFAQVGLGDPNMPYAISLAGRDIDLAGLVNATRAEKLDLAGYLDGRVTVDGRLGDGARRGRGELLLSRARIYQAPPVVQMFAASRTPRPANANQTANLLFNIVGKRMIFEEVNLRDPSLSLMGTGTMDLTSRELDLTFVAGEPSSKSAGGARLLEEMLSGAGEALVRYQVTGPLFAPQVEAVPLHTVRQAIEELTAARKRYQAAQPQGPAVAPASPGAGK